MPPQVRRVNGELLDPGVPYDCVNVEWYPRKSNNPDQVFCYSFLQNIPDGHVNVAIYIPDLDSFETFDPPRPYGDHIKRQYLR